MAVGLSVLVALMAAIAGYWFAKRKTSCRVPTAKPAPLAIPREGHSPFLFSRMEPGVMLQRSAEYAEWASQRRSCRAFSSERVPADVLKNCIRAAGTSPSGAHTEPWKYVIVTDGETRQTLRDVIEAEERENYARSRIPTFVRTRIRLMIPQANGH
jgi:hypothetical protein